MEFEAWINEAVYSVRLMLDKIVPWCIAVIDLGKLPIFRMNQTYIVKDSLE